MRRASQPEAPAAAPRRTGGLVRRKLHAADLARIASVGIRTRKLRAGLSALGIAIGVAAIVAVLGLSASAEAGLLAEINQLGTNLLVVTNGQSFSGGTAELSKDAPAMIARIGPVTSVDDTGLITAEAYRTNLVPAVNTNGLSVDAASLDLPATVGAPVVAGHYLSAATAEEPVCVLGAAAAQRLGIDTIFAGERIWVGGMWFYLAGVLGSSALTPEIDDEVLVGFPAAEKYLGFDGHPSTIYLRATTSEVDEVDAVLANTANPEFPNEVDVSQPSDALVAQADAQGALNGLVLALGAVALLVGAVGVANIMVISVLERRSEIGLRRALGATKGHVRTQFLAESMLLGLIGGVAGVTLGVISTAVYDSAKHFTVVVPPVAWAGGVGAAVVIGGLSGLLPALRAARMSPTEALRSV